MLVLTSHALGWSSTSAPRIAHRRGSPPRLAEFGEGSLEELRAEIRAFSDARDWAQFHSPRSLALAMVGEVGEVCELLQWRRWDGETAGLPQWSDEERARLGEELSDVLSYVIRLADVAEIDLPAAARAKFKANALKYPADAARGTSAKYTELPSDAVVCTGEPSTDPARDAQAAAENAHYD